VPTLRRRIDADADAAVGETTHGVAGETDVRRRSRAEQGIKDRTSADRLGDWSERGPQLRRAWAALGGLQAAGYGQELRRPA
jgi:hypothetical protein